MYQYNTTTSVSTQVKSARNPGFTLVEIMIVILIIIMLTQLGNISSLFRYKEKGQIEEIATQLLGLIDEEKTNALLGRTQKSNTSGSGKWQIVRKRTIDISIDKTKHTLSLLSQVNLADKEESVYEPESITKAWSLPGLEGAWYDCSTGDEGVKIQNAGADTEDVSLDFIGDSIQFNTKTTTASPLAASHIVIRITNKGSSEEIHIDRRTGLTYARPSSSDTVSCN